MFYISLALAALFIVASLLYMMAKCAVKTLQSDYRYDPQTNRWAKVAPMSTKRLGVAVAVLGSYLYAMGGSDGTSPLNTGKILQCYFIPSTVHHTLGLKMSLCDLCSYDCILYTCP